MERGIFGALGIIVALFGALFLVFFIAEFSTGGNGRTQPPVYAGLIVFFGGTMVGGAFLVWQMLKKRPGAPSDDAASSTPAPAPPSQADRERTILRFVEKEHGRVTVPEVAAHCDMTIAEAKAALDRLVTLQAATIQMTAAGVLVYVFPGFLSDEEKSSATDF